MIIPLLKIEYFNPVVKNWDESAKIEEEKQKQLCDIHLYTITPRMVGVYSIAELTESAILKPNNTVLLIITEDEGSTFSEEVLNSLNSVISLVKKYGISVFINDYTAAANKINSYNIFNKKKISLIDTASVTESCTATDLEFHGVFEVAMEGTTIPTAVREKLPDDAFGIVYKDADGKKVRKYPLKVKGDMESTKELQRKAIAFFHYCRPDWKKKLAKKIIDAIRETDSGVKISPKSQIAKYINIPEDMLGEEYKYNKK